MELPVFHVFTHDSIGLGEDGPTHQPIEQLVALRAIPNMIVLRPADANEVCEAYKVILEQTEEPACLVLSRQKLPIFDRERYAPASGLARGAYVLADAETGKPEVILIASGSEVQLCVTRLRNRSNARALLPVWSACRVGSCSSGRIALIATQCCRRGSPRGWQSKWAP